MDYEGFYLHSPEGLSIIMTAFNLGCKDPFPIEMIYGPWDHTKGQVWSEDVTLEYIVHWCTYVMYLVYCRYIL